MRIIFIFLLIIFSFHFFEAHFLNENLIKYGEFLFSLAAIIISIPFFFIKNKGFVLPVRIICICTVISIFMAYFTWNQPIVESLKSTVPYMLWFFFFYLIGKKISIKVIENIIILYGILYIILYFFQFTHPNIVLFGWYDEFVEDRGVIRIIFPGGGIFFLTSFLSLNKLTSKKSKKTVIWLILSLMGLLIPILQATRQFIIVTLFIYLIHFSKNLNLFKKILFSCIYIVLILFFYTLNDPIIRGLKDVQEETLEQGKDYIRIQSGLYFLTDFSPNTYNKIFGNGVPYGNKTDYGKFVSDLQQNLHFYLSDVGIIAFYAMFGIFVVFAYILIWIKSITYHLPEEYYYLKYYLWFLLGTSLTSLSVFHEHYLISTIFVLYIFQIKYKKQTY